MVVVIVDMVDGGDGGDGCGACGKVEDGRWRHLATQWERRLSTATVEPQNCRKYQIYQQKWEETMDHFWAEPPAPTLELSMWGLMWPVAARSRTWV